MLPWRYSEESDSFSDITRYFRTARMLSPREREFRYEVIQSCIQRCNTVSLHCTLLFYVSAFAIVAHNPKKEMEYESNHFTIT